MSNSYPSTLLPLVPEAVASIIGARNIPDSLASVFGRGLGLQISDIADLKGSDIPPDELKRVGNYIKESTQRKIAAMRKINSPISQDILLFRNIESRLSARTINALIEAGVVDDTDIASITLSELANTHGLGVIGLLELLGNVQIAPKSYSHAVALKTDERISRNLNKAAKEIARKRWAAKLYDDDPRLKNHIMAIEMSANSVSVKQIAESLIDKPLPPAEAKAKLREIQRLERKVTELSEQKLKSEIRQVIEAVGTRQRNIDIISDRIGGEGLKPKTLEKVGTEYGITRERVRQIEKKFVDIVGRYQSIWMPSLDKSLSVISQNLPLTEKEVKRLLLNKGLSRGELEMTSIIRLAEVFSRKYDFEFDPDKSIVASKNFLNSTPLVLNTAISMVGHWGAINLQLLSEELEIKGILLGNENLVRILNLRSDVVWLDYKEKWFWIRGAPKNRILNYVRKIMSVAGTCNISELRNGTGRWHRVHGYRLPTKILVALCLSTGQYRIQDDRLVGDERLSDWREILGPNERKIVEILFQHGYIMRRADLEAAALQAGVSRESFYILITYSPVIERYATGVYGLRGAPVRAAQIESIIPAIQRKTRLFKDNGWTESGHLWIGYKLSQSSVNSGVVSVPSSLISYIPGPYRLFSDSALPVGTLTVGDRNLWGLSRFFRKWNVEADDYIVIEFDPRKKRAVIISGDEELITKYQEGSDENRNS